MDIFYNKGQYFSHTDYFKLQEKTDNGQHYIYPIEIDMSISCPPYNDKELVERANNFTYDIPDDILNDVKKGLCKILFDFTHECYDVTYKYNGHRDFTHIMITNTQQKYSLDKSELVLACGNAKPYKDVEYNVVTVQNQLFTPIYQGDVFLHNKEYNILNVTENKYKLLTFMGKPYYHRARLANFIYQNNLKQYNIVSCLTPFDDIAISNWKDQLHLSEEFLNTLPWEYDATTQDVHQDIKCTLTSEPEKQAHMDSYISFVSETFFSYTSNDNNDYELDMTAKSTKPIVTMQPFILHAQIGALKYIKSFGFETFDKWWDESYDAITTHDDRYNHLTDIYKKLSLTPHRELALMIKDMHPILRHNLDLYNDIRDNGKYLKELHDTLEIMFHKG
jgi:hypothetical protein|tara:strand:- start:42 stop:1217 length:1176 start_codon:yes stop_codon:yes gene_type:complete